MKNFILMVQFLTRIPIPITIDVKEDSFVKGVTYYPIVGLIIGGINAIVYYLVSLLNVDYLPIIMVLLSNTLVTGAFHLDGLADTCDAIYSARSKERMLEIMKDSRVGTNGVLAIVFDLALRFLLLMVLPKDYIYIGILLSPVVAKTCVGFLIGISKYARKEGLAGLYLDKMTKGPVIVCILIGLSVLLFTLQIKGLILMGFYLTISYLYKVYIYKKIDGMTGDTLGAANELMEVIFLFTLVYIAN